MSISHSTLRFLLPAAILFIASLAQAQYLIEPATNLGGKLRFLNAAEGFSFNNYTIRYTADSGNTWNVITSDIAAETGCSGVLDAWFVDRSTGWMVVYYGGGINTPIDTTCVYATTDGGATWRKQLTSRVSQIKWASQTFQGIRFVDRMNGWVFGLGVIEHTTDGGATWTTQMRFTERTIYNNLFTCGFFKNKNEGWIAGYGSFILHTTDAGATWVTRHVDSASTPDGIILNVDTYYLRAIHFSDSLNGCASSNHGYYLYTTDGGATWNPGSTGFPHDNEDVFIADNRVIWMVGGNYCDNTGCYAGQSVLYSTNGGTTWNPVIARTVGLLGVDAQFTSIAWINSRLGYISDEFGRIFRISDTTALVASIGDVAGGSHEVNMYPNPVADELTIQFDGADREAQVNVYDAIGRRVIVTSLNAASGKTLDVSVLNPGNYMVEVMMAGKASRRNIMVVR